MESEAESLDNPRETECWHDKDRNQFSIFNGKFSETRNPQYAITWQL